MVGGNIMTLDTFIKMNKRDAISIPVSEIVLTSYVHKKDVEKGKTIEGELSSDEIIVVQRLLGERGDKAKYGLVTGWKALMKAYNTHTDKIKAIVVPYTRKRFMEYLSARPKGVIDFSLIEVPDRYNITPNPFKVDFVRRQIDLLGGHTLDNPIAIRINTNGEVKLVDGYIRYLIAKDRGMTAVPFTVKKTKSKNGKGAHNANNNTVQNCV